MPRPRFKSLKPEKQEQILESASEEFSEKGFDAASLNRIIENAGISKGAAYYYFDDKSDLFSTVIEHSLRKLAKVAGDFSMSDLQADNFWERLERYAVDSMGSVQTNAWVRRTVKTMWKHLDSNSVAGRALWVATRTWTAEFVERGQALGMVRGDIPNELLIEMIVGWGFAVDRWMLHHVEDFSETERIENARLLISVFRNLVEPKDTE